MANGKEQTTNCFLYRFAITFELLPFDYSRVFKAEIGARQQRADGHVPIPRPAGAALRELRPGESLMVITFSLSLCFLTHSGFVRNTARGGIPSRASSNLGQFSIRYPSRR